MTSYPITASQTATPTRDELVEGSLPSSPESRTGRSTARRNVGCRTRNWPGYATRVSPP